MTICENCIKKDVCKFRKSVEKYEGDKLPEPLVPSMGCKYKKVELTPTCTIWNDTTTYYSNKDTTTYIPYPELVTTDSCWTTS